MSDLSSQQEEKNATISLTVSSVTAFSVEAIISVSVPSHVWCQALKQGEYFNTEKLLSSGHKQYISSMKLVLMIILIRISNNRDFFFKSINKVFTPLYCCSL